MFCALWTFCNESCCYALCLSTLFYRVSRYSRYTIGWKMISREKVNGKERITFFPFWTFLKFDVRNFQMKTKLANFPLRKYRINFVSLIREKRRRERNRFPVFFYYSHNQQFSFITFHRTFIIRINFCPIIFYFQHQSSTPMGLKKSSFWGEGKCLLSHVSCPIIS